MQFRKLLAPVFAPIALGAMFGLAACGDESTAPANSETSVVDPTTTPVVDPNNPVVDPGTPVVDPSTPVVDPSNPSVDPTTPSTGWASTVALAATADVNYPTLVYNLWKPAHFVTLEDESVYYSSIADDFGDVFTAAYLPAGRVIWSAQSTGYYKSVCQNEESSDRTMKFRGCTVSEGTGYGMLLTYFNGDDDAFVRIWNYSRAYRNYFGQDLTPWITLSFRFNDIDNSSATDADLDIATALILMYYRTGMDIYRTDALKIVNAIWNLEVNKSNLLIYSGDTDMWTGADPTYNLCYFSPVALRLFALIDPSHNWLGVLDAMYTYMALVQDLGTGVFPDWSNGAGVAVAPPNNSADKNYYTFNKEAVRIPWRIAWDYYWYNEPRALAILQKLNNFIVAKSAGDPSSAALGTNYSWDPAKKDITGSASSVVPAHWLAAWCATGVGTNANWLNSCTNLVNATMPTNSNTSYYTDILLGMYSALLNGKMVKPRSDI